MRKRNRGAPNKSVIPAILKRESKGHGFPIKAFGNDSSERLRFGITGDRKGFTLLELILALTMISVILLATTTLSVSAVRLTSNISEEVRLHNQIQYVLRDMELQIRAGKNPTVTPSDGCPVEASCLQVTDPSGANYIKYVYDPNNSKTISRLVIRISDGVVLSSTDLSSGIVIPKPDKSLFFIPSPSEPLVEINVTAQRTRNGKTITIPGITKSILLRGI